MASIGKKTLNFVKDVFIPIPPTVDFVKEENSAGIEYVRTTNSNALQSSSSDKEKLSSDDIQLKQRDDDDSSSTDSAIEEYELISQGRTHRKLNNRHVQLIGIGGTIGIALFVSISSTLHICGPLSLVLGCIIWCTPVLCVTAGCAEMVSYLPISSPFVRIADRAVDPAFGFMAGWNFWVLESSLVPFEITLVNSLLHYWGDDYSPAIPISCQLAAYFVISLSAVKYYGEVEFWMALGKVVLAVGLMLFVFVTMVGGNPKHDAYGFRYWSTPMVEYIHTGALGRFQGFVASITKFCFVVAGPEYVSQIAGETINPRKVLPSAYKQVAIRLTVFFVGGALGVSICCYYNDPLLVEAINGGAPGAGASAYTVAMKNLGINVLPNIVNVLLITASFSAGNSYTYCSSRALYGMALEGKALRIFSYCNKDGVPIFAILVTLGWGCLAYLQLGQQASVVLDWIVNLVTASQMLNFTFIVITYLFFRRAFNVQVGDRSKLPFKSWGQPYISYYALFMTFSMLWVQGYTVFLPGNWSVESFLFSYLMIFIDIGLYIFWKVYKRTPFVKPEDADITTGLAEVEAHERYLAAIEATQPKKKHKWWQKIVYVIFDV
ncbi:hypothetical protein B5S31_g1032 [[Candida] boidinii]|nr:hypothetical protein B5S31_g1032 [[Candida] boidinii]